tara:strand:+ start:236 stop:745 length:510 start_codon:yes stop_codon:yes gene_type:complete
MSIICTSFEQACLLSPQKTMFVDGDWMHINAHTAQEVMEQCGYVSHEKLRLCVYANDEKMFMDAEGSAELCRLLHVDQKINSRERMVVPVLPCDYSICLLASMLNIECVEVVLGHPLFERGIMRPEIVQHIIRDAQLKVIAGGVFDDDAVEKLMTWGAFGVHHYQREKA